jgi:hypothetical protein
VDRFVIDRGGDTLVPGLSPWNAELNSPSRLKRTSPLRHVGWDSQRQQGVRSRLTPT